MSLSTDSVRCDGFLRLAPLLRGRLRRRPSHSSCKNASKQQMLYTVKDSSIREDSKGKGWLATVTCPTHAYRHQGEGEHFSDLKVVQEDNKERN